MQQSLPSCSAAGSPHKAMSCFRQTNNRASPQYLCALQVQIARNHITCTRTHSSKRRYWEEDWNALAVMRSQLQETKH